MCGIWAIFAADQCVMQSSLAAYNKIHHRGPDAWRIENDSDYKNCCLGFHRLAIVDNKAGMQPMRLRNYSHLRLICNGEIYNCQRLQREFGFGYETSCDVESIIHLYVKSGGDIEYCASHLDGVFAFCLLDAERRKVFIARDTFGVRPLFRLEDSKGFLAICSEIKGLMDLSKKLNGDSSINHVMPGHCEEYDLHNDGRVTLVSRKRFHSIGSLPKYELYVSPKSLDTNDFYANVRRLFTAAVEKRMMAERRIGCLLSGGLDSSLAAAVLLKLAKEKDLKYPVQTFAVGLDNSPDIIAARRVAKYIGSEHYEVIVTQQQISDALDDVIYHLETYDITTIRASVCMYLLSEYINKTTDTTVIFSGEGADELAQGYIYFRDSPSAEASDAESRRLMEDLYMFDVLRSDRSTAAHGLEMRVPFLDHQFTSYFLSLPKSLRQPKNGVEKHLLRKSFEDTGLLPNDILWRHKEAFSDGVASKKKSLFVIIAEFTENKVTDKELAAASTMYPHNTPKTKESFYYRRTFERFYPGQHHLIPYIWMPKWTNATDPSARFLAHYAADSPAESNHVTNGNSY